MAEAIGIGSGLLAFAQFAVTSCATIYNTVESFKGNQKVMRDLLRELKELAVVLQFLYQLLENDSTGLPELDGPLTCCGKTCQELQILIVGCKSNSGGTLDIVWDWSKLQRNGTAIAAFKETLATYKSTISLAVCGVNLRTVSTTAKVVGEVKELAIETKQELQEQLLRLDTQLQTFIAPNDGTFDEDAAEREWIQEEKEGIQKCLGVLAQMSEHIDEDWRNSSRDLFSTRNSRYTQAVTLGDLISAPRVTSNGVQKCKGALTQATSALEEHLHQMDNRMQSLSVRIVRVEGDDDPACQRAQEERESINRCLGICDDAVEQAERPRTNVFDDISAGLNSYQVIVSTIGDLISARRVTAEAGATQCFGQMQNTFLQRLSRDRACATGSTRGATRVGKARGAKVAEGTARERSAGGGNTGREKHGEEEAGT